MASALSVAGALVVLMAALSGTAVTATGGRDLFERRCGGCHALDRDKEGPRLRSLIGRTAGSVGGYEYSEALRKAGFAWSVEKLEQWLEEPDRLVPENNMAFRLESAAERKEIIDYLTAAP